jgi:formiminotetrahydrofolate cyclodeaminase
MLDTRQGTRASLLERPLGEIVDAIADGDISSRDGSLPAVASATSAGFLIAACTDLADQPECQPRLMELARVLARARYLHQRLPAQFDDVADAERSLADARGLPLRDVRDHTSRRSAVQRALRRALDRRLAVATVAAELAGMAREVQLLAGGKHAALTRLAETLAGTALAWMLETVDREVDEEGESWPREYVGSELERLRRAARALSADESNPSEARVDPSTPASA